MGKELWESLVVAFNEVKEQIEAVFGWVTKLIRNLFGMDKKTEDTGKKQNWLITVIQKVAEVFRVLIKILTFIIKPISFLAKIVINVLGAAFRSVLKIVGGLGKALFKLFTGDLKGAKDAVVDALAGVKEAFASIPEKIKESNKEAGSIIRGQITASGKHAEEQQKIFANTQRRMTENWERSVRQRRELDRGHFIRSLELENEAHAAALRDRETREAAARARRMAQAATVRIPTGRGPAPIRALAPGEARAMDDFRRRTAGRGGGGRKVTTAGQAGLDQLKALGGMGGGGMGGGMGGGGFGGGGMGMGGGGFGSFARAPGNLGTGPGGGGGFQSGFLRFAEAQAAIQGIEGGGKLVEGMDKWLGAMDKLFGRGGKKLNDWLRGLEKEAVRSAGRV